MTNSILHAEECAQVAKRGRRPKGEYPEKKRVFASRIREDTWEMLQQSATRSGRSKSQEFEHQLRRALDEDKRIEDTFGDSRTFALMKIAAMAAVNSSLLSPTQSKGHWTSSVEAFDRALEAVVAALKLFRPHELTAAALETKSARHGAPTLELVHAIQAADPTRSLDRMSNRQRAMLRLKDELGELADRPGRSPQPRKQKTKERKT